MTPPPSDMLGIIFALSSALVWGSGDFSGGLASRKSSSFQVMALSALTGLMVLVAASLLWRETFPSLNGVLWSILAGVSGSVGIASLYRALAIGNAATVAPTSAVIGAALPVGFTILTRGIPAIPQLAGFLLAFLGIWLVSRSVTAESAVSRQGFLLACLAGVGFSGFFVFIAQVEPGKVFTPLIVSRSVMFLTALLLLRSNHLPLPAFRANPIALLAGVLDAGGNILFLLARQFTRLDTAVVLSSLYPASTVVLAAILLKEKVTRWQWMGVVLCLVAIVLITI